MACSQTVALYQHSSPVNFAATVEFRLARKPESTETF